MRFLVKLPKLLVYMEWLICRSREIRTKSGRGLCCLPLFYTMKKALRIQRDVMMVPTVLNWLLYTMKNTLRNSIVLFGVAVNVSYSFLSF